MMRKWIIALSVMVFFVSYYSITQANVDGIRMEDLNDDSILVTSLPTEPKKQLYQILIFPEESFNQVEAAKIVNRLSMLPDPLLTQIVEYGITVKLFEGKLTDNPTASHLRGVIPRGYQTETTWDDVPGIGGGKTVLVKIGHSEKGKGHGSVNLELHELAHSIDRFILKDLRYHRPFLDIWEKERAVLFQGQSYFLLFPEEYFAETFAMFYLNKDTRKTLYENAPLTYEFIKNLSESNNQPSQMVLAN
jgi:Pro-Pro endopeptidase